VTPTERRRAVRRLLASSVRRKRRLLVELATWSGVQALPTFLSGRLIGRALDDGFLADRPATGFAMLALLTASIVVGALGTRETFRRLAALVEPFRDDLVTQTVRGAIAGSVVPGARQDAAGVGRLTHHVEVVREAYASVLVVVQGFLVGAVSAVAGLGTLVPQALVLVLPPLLISLAVFALVLARTAPQQRTSILANERIAESANQMAGGLRDVTASGGEEAMARAVGGHIDAQARATVALGRLTAASSLAVAVGGMLPVVLLLIRGPALLRQGVSTGALLGCLTYVLYGVHPALQTLVRQLGTTGLWLFVAAGRIVEANAPERPSTGMGRRTAGTGPADVALHHVTFRYGSRAEPVIDELDLTIPEGDHLVVVGPSGIGKSTLANLIAGMLEPEAGEVRIGGTPLRDLDPQELVQQRVLIPQEAYVFAGSLEENLTYLRPDATEQEVDEAVDELGMRPLVQRLGGLHAQVQGSSLSAGERQHVTLVRAYLSPAPIAILDEASCHLDPVTEAVVEQAFARRDGTLIVIAHRVSSALRGRRVLVMDGTEVQVGTREEVLEASPLYRDLVGHWL
jgi:ATP-binding cassette subfamily C protein